jgi:Fe-S-cluster-containing hydrogenase component 2
VAEQKPNMHYVATRDEFRKTLEGQRRFFVSDCGCRTGSEKGCRRSRTDICLGFHEGATSGGSNLREVTRADVDAILKEAEERHLVTRPFRDEARTATDGACFCCDCCCGYFTGTEKYVCDKGALVERTDRDGCTDCGECAEVCYFGARKMDRETLAVARERCFGCGLCADVCPTGCIEMVGR